MSTQSDWRIGLTVKPKWSGDPLWYERGKVIDVLPSGTGGLFDDNGILKIEMQSSGHVILRRSDDWVTA